MRSTRTRVLAASVAALATFAVSACGGDDDDDAETTEAEAEASSPSSGAETTASGGTGAEVTTDITEGTTTGSGDSGGGEVGTREEYVEATSSEIGADMDDQEMADCLSEALVNDDVYAAIEQAGLTVEGFAEDGPADLGITEEQAQGIAGDVASCGDLVAQLSSEEPELGCLEENFSNDQIAELLTLSVFGLEPGEDLQAANTAVEECLSASTTTTG